MAARAAEAAQAGASAQTLGLRTPRARFGVANAALAAFVIAIVGLMVVPLPTWLLDLLIASNLAASVAVLLVALYVGDALKIAAHCVNGWSVGSTCRSLGGV
jgi:flagellar biosynthesis component FlhA